MGFNVVASLCVVRALRLTRQPPLFGTGGPYPDATTRIAAPADSVASAEVSPSEQGHPWGIRARGEPSVAASGEWRGEDGIRLPSGEAHAWHPGTNQTLCGLALSRSHLRRFHHVSWPDVFLESGDAADEVRQVCRRCLAASGRRSGRGWSRSPRPETRPRTPGSRTARRRIRRR